MSLTATLLLGKPIQLPAGKVRVHSLRDSAGWCNASQKGIENNARIRAANVKSVTESIRAGSGFFTTISDETGLSEPTVRSIVRELIDQGKAFRDGQRGLVLKGDSHA